VGWFQRGYETSFPYEGIADEEHGFKFNDEVAKNGEAVDTVDKLRKEHVMEFTKISIGYLVELSWAPESKEKAPMPQPDPLSISEIMTGKKNEDKE
jgi:hypothetical protein